MKRDIFHRGARFTHDYSKNQNEFEHFDPDYPRGMKFNTRGFCDHDDGLPYDPFNQKGAIEKPDGTKACRGREDAPYEGFFGGIKLRTK